GSQSLAVPIRISNPGIPVATGSRLGCPDRPTYLLFQSDFSPLELRMVGWLVCPPLRERPLMGMVATPIVSSVISRASIVTYSLMGLHRSARTLPLRRG